MVHYSMCKGWSAMSKEWPMAECTPMYEEQLAKDKAICMVTAGPSAKLLTDSFTMDMLGYFSLLGYKHFFQDFPFIWRENDQHLIFKHQFFTTHREAWHRWCLVQLNYTAFMQAARTKHINLSSWDSGCDQTKRLRHATLGKMLRGDFDLLQQHSDSVLIGAMQQEIAAATAAATATATQMMRLAPQGPTQQVPLLSAITLSLTAYLCHCFYR
jgi:hypothetical protein